MQEVRSHHRKKPRAWSAWWPAKHGSQPADKGLSCASIQLPEKKVSLTEFLGERPEQMAVPSFRPDTSDASTMQLIPAATSWLQRSFIHHPLGMCQLGPAHSPSFELCGKRTLTDGNGTVSMQWLSGLPCPTKALLSSSGEWQPRFSNCWLP